jgi:hypothetical protein
MIIFVLLDTTQSIIAFGSRVVEHPNPKAY